MASPSKTKAPKKPAAKKPAAKKPAAKKPVAKKPAAKKPVAKKPAAKKPVATKPAAAKKPIVKKPVTTAQQQQCTNSLNKAWEARSTPPYNPAKCQNLTRAKLCDNYKAVLIKPGVWQWKKTGKVKNCKQPNKSGSTAMQMSGPALPITGPDVVSEQPFDTPAPPPVVATLPVTTPPAQAALVVYPTYAPSLYATGPAEDDTPINIRVNQALDNASPTNVQNTVQSGGGGGGGGTDYDTNEWPGTLPLSPGLQGYPPWIGYPEAIPSLTESVGYVTSPPTAAPDPQLYTTSTVEAAATPPPNPPPQSKTWLFWTASVLCGVGVLLMCVYAISNYKTQGPSDTTGVALFPTQYSV